MSAGIELFHCMACNYVGPSAQEREHLATCKARMRALAVAEAQGKLERVCQDLAKLADIPSSERDRLHLSVMDSKQVELVLLGIEFGRALNMPSV